MPVWYEISREFSQIQRKYYVLEHQFAVDMEFVILQLKHIIAFAMNFGRLKTVHSSQVGLTYYLSNFIELFFFSKFLKIVRGDSVFAYEKKFVIVLQCKHVEIVNMEPAT